MSHFIIIIRRNCRVLKLYCFRRYLYWKNRTFFFKSSSRNFHQRMDVFMSFTIQKMQRKFFTAVFFNQTRKMTHSKFHCHKKLFVWKRVIKKKSYLWGLKKWTTKWLNGNLYIPLLLNRLKMFHMKWVTEAKKCVLILYRYINNEVMKFENICDLWG